MSEPKAHNPSAKLHILWVMLLAVVCATTISACTSLATHPDSIQVSGRFDYNFDTYECSDLIKKELGLRRQYDVLYAQQLERRRKDSAYVVSAWTAGIMVTLATPYGLLFGLLALGKKGDDRALYNNFRDTKAELNAVRSTMKGKKCQGSEKFTVLPPRDFEQNESDTSPGVVPQSPTDVPAGDSSGSPASVAPGSEDGVYGNDPVDALAGGADETVEPVPATP